MKTKNLFFTITLMTLTFLVSAQDKYEYMTIEFNQFLKKEIQISIDGKEYIEEKADYSPNEKALHNSNPLLKKVSEYETNGWELMYFHTIGDTGNPVVPVRIAYLRKKKK